MGIGTSDGKYYESGFEFLASMVPRVNPKGFEEAEKTWPLSTNIEDRRGEKPITTDPSKWGKSGPR